MAHIDPPPVGGIDHGDGLDRCAEQDRRAERRGERERQGLGAVLQAHRRGIDRVAVEALHAGGRLEERVAGGVLGMHAHAEAGDELVHARLVCPEPRGAEVEGVRIIARHRQQPPAHAIARLEHADAQALGCEPGRQGQAGDPGADDDRVEAVLVAQATFSSWIVLPPSTTNGCPVT